uniref:Replicase n=1 Tax=Varicosavirus lactucae TaxID=1985698 RepID=H6UYY9_9RHAB|nr:L-protein [Varicosavirus lactucae]
MSLASRMTSVGGADNYGESDYGWDETVLGDMHLNSAINLDLFKEFLHIDSPVYKVKENHRLTEELRELQSLARKSAKIEIGFQRLFARMFPRDGNLIPMDSTMTRMIMKIIRDSGTKYKLGIPLLGISEEMIKEGAMVPSNLVYSFNCFLNIIYGRSEWIRSEGIAIRFKMYEHGRFIRRDLTISGKEYNFIVGKEVVEIRASGRKERFIADYNSLLLLLDVAGQRICAHLCSQLGEISGVPGSLSRYHLETLCTAGDRMIERCGNKAYEVLGMYEALCVGRLLENNPDGITDHTQFSANCEEELQELITGSVEPAFMKSQVDLIKATLEKMKNQDISNAFCLYRVWGHPTVDIYEGMKKVHTIGTKVKVIPPNLGTIMVCQFRKMFMSTFFKKHHRYPPITGTPGEYLERCLKDNVAIRIEHLAYNLRDFEFIRIGETYSVPDTFDMCHVLNDKAVSPDMSELLESIKNGKGTSCGAKRRGILRWMEGDSLNCKSFLSDIDEKGLSEEDLLIGMYEKEREIKVAARMYSLMTERMRYYFVLTEGLIADYILPHFPEITMKDSLNVLLKKMWESGGQRSIGSMDVNINIDFSKWNTNMREGPTSDTFREMDGIFGFKRLITRTHEIFNASLVYSASGKYLPTVENGRILDDPPMCYRGHLGGFEGLRQKGWTVATVCLLAYLSEQNKIQMKLMGQGDNQIIRLRMPTSYWDSLRLTEEMKKKEARILSDKFVHEMDIIFTGVGLPIKVRETWKSTRLFMYGKVMLLDGRQLPQWYKKTLRSYALSNEGTLTISGVIGTIATNMCAAGGGSEVPCVMYLFFLLLAEWSLEFMFRYHPFTRVGIKDGSSMEFRLNEKGGCVHKQTQKTNNLWLKSLLVLVPTAVGGSVTIPLTGFIMRGFPDKASEGYAWLKFLGSSKSPIQGFLKNFYTFLPNDTVEADMLVQSPFSLNHKRPPTPGLQTKENIREWLLSTPRFQQNRFIRSMQVLLSGFDKKSVCRELLTERMNPLISHEVYETFGHVYCEGIVARVENTRTIRTLHLSREDRKPIVAKLMTDEMAYIAYMWWRGNTKGEVVEECATKQARKGRNVGWKREIMGITTPHPLEVLFQSVCRPGDQCQRSDDYITSKLVDDGKFPPFLGSKIKNKVYSLQDEEARREPLIKTGARLARQFNWIGMGENMRGLVLKNVGSICDVSVFDKFVDDDPSDNLYTGSLMHRFTPSSVSEGCFINYAPQVGHKVFMSSDTLPSLSRGQTNYTFHFQAMYCFLQYSISKSGNEGSYHHHIMCQDCVVPVEDEFDDIPSETPSIVKAQEEQYVSIIRTTLGYIHTKPRSAMVLEDKSPIGRYIEDVEGHEKELYSGVVELLCWKSALEILGRTRDTHATVGTEDLQGWPRIYAYKVSRRHIIGRVTSFLLYILAVQIGELPLPYSMERVSRRAIDVVSRVGLEGFSAVASLCLGRDIPMVNDVVTIVDGFAYPETVSVCLRSIKASILMTIGKVIRVDSFMSRRSVYPTESMTSDDFLRILGFKAVIFYGCTKIHEQCQLKGLDQVTYAEMMCHHRCLEKLLSSNLLTHMTMDRAMKYLPIKITKILPQISSTRPNTIAVTREVETENREFSDTFPIDERVTYPEMDLKTHQMIQYPTSSIYKWSDILLGIEHYDHVIVMGDGTGGTSMVAAHMFPNSIIYPMALLESKNLIPQDMESLAPPMSRKLTNVDSSLLIDLPDDIRKPAFRTRMLERVLLMRGNILIISDIEGTGTLFKDIVSTCLYMPTSTDVLMKTHLADLCGSYYMMKGAGRIRLRGSRLANLRYGEVFVSFRVTGGNIRPNRRGLGNCIQEVMIGLMNTQVETATGMLSQIESMFPLAADMSMNIAMMKMASWGGSFSRKVLGEDGLKLMGYVYQYINTHYHFASSSYRPGDNRTVTPGRKEDLTKLLCSIMLGVYGEDTETVEEVSKYTLIGSKKGVPGKSYFKVLMWKTGTKRTLEHDEYMVGRAIRNYRTRILEAKKLDGPIGLPFHSGSLRKIATWGYKIPISASGGWIDNHLQI